MFPSSPLPRTLVSELQQMTISSFCKSFRLKTKVEKDDELFQFDIEYYYGSHQLGSASALYHVRDKTLEVTGFYPFQQALELRGKSLGVVFYQKFLEKINPHIEKDMRVVRVIPNRVNTSEYIGFLERLGFDGRAPFPYQTLLERTLLTARRRSSIAQFVITN